MNAAKMISMIVFAFFLASKSCLAGSVGDIFKEKLLLTPLEHGFVSSYFNFAVENQWNTGPSAQLHYNLFPKSLGQVVRKHHVRELHLSLTQGVWRQDKWGYPPAGAPPGTQLWAWFSQDTEDIDEAWGDLVNALSGLFCASLNFIDETNTLQPQLSFRPQGVASDSYARNNSLVRYATLPREIVCTENLTPWKKLLPCNSKAGLASLFKAEKLYNAHYHSLVVDFRHVCPAGRSPCSDPSVELSLSLLAVFRPPAASRGSNREVSLRALFGKVLDGPCPMAASSQVMVDVSQNHSSQVLTLTPDPSEIITESIANRGVAYAIYDVKEWADRKNALNVMITWDQPVHYVPLNPPPLLAYRYLSGYGLERGGLSCLLRNTLAQPLQVIYTETIQWYTRPYLHTLKIRSGKSDIEPDHVVFVPGKDRSKPYLLEVVLTLPASSDTTLSIDFDKAFLRWTEYPPDAHIGFFINSAIVSVLLPNTNNMSGIGLPGIAESAGSEMPGGFFLRLYTEPLLVQLPTPDFSMPYNVICLACTVVAIGFGSLHNLTTRRFGFMQQATGKQGGRLQRLLGKFRRKGKTGRGGGRGGGGGGSGGGGDGDKDSEDKTEENAGPVDSVAASHDDKSDER